MTKAESKELAKYIDSDGVLHGKPQYSAETHVTDEAAKQAILNAAKDRCATSIEILNKALAELDGAMAQGLDSSFIEPDSPVEPDGPPIGDDSTILCIGCMQLHYVDCLDADRLCKKCLREKMGGKLPAEMPSDETLCEFCNQYAVSKEDKCERCEKLICFSCAETELEATGRRICDDCLNESDGIGKVGGISTVPDALDALGIKAKKAKQEQQDVKDAIQEAKDSLNKPKGKRDPDKCASCNLIYTIHKCTSCWEPLCQDCAKTFNGLRVCESCLEIKPKKSEWCKHCHSIKTTTKCKGCGKHTCQMCSAYNNGKGDCICDSCNEQGFAYIPEDHSKAKGAEVADGPLFCKTCKNQQTLLRCALCKDQTCAECLHKAIDGNFYCQDCFNAVQLKHGKATLDKAAKWHAPNGTVGGMDA